MSTCKICSTEAEHESYRVREMQFGTREEFIYFQCVHCGCLQLRDIPANLAKYYPDYYPAFSSVSVNGITFLNNTVRKYAKRKIIDHRLGGSSLVGKLFER